MRRQVFGGEPEIPPEGEHLWEWFWSAHRGRQQGMMGWQAIPSTDWLAWQAMYGHIVLDEEWDVLQEMDTAFIGASFNRAKAGQNGTLSAPDGVLPELTAQAFDAVFG